MLLTMKIVAEYGSINWRICILIMNHGVKWHVVTDPKRSLFRYVLGEVEEIASGEGRTM